MLRVIKCNKIFLTAYIIIRVEKYRNQLNILSNILQNKSIIYIIQ